MISPHPIFDEGCSKMSYMLLAIVEPYNSGIRLTRVLEVEDPKRPANKRLMHEIDNDSNINETP